MDFIPAELILKKKSGKAHSPEEIQWLILAFTDGRLPDYQMSAWAMAVCFQGMNEEEVAQLTLAMRDSGSKFNFSTLNNHRIDKHSTGGVGDKTSLILGPLLAAGEIYSPMIAGRGLGHTGGTLDKLESIPGFRVRLTADEFVRLVREKYFALMGQTENICPADRKLYALRDVTGTVDSMPLICASIMSKKLCEDLTGLVLDVKFGSGAFMKSLEEAEKLARLLKSTGERNGVKVHALLTNMNEPLGRFAGNACEVQECLAIMRGETLVEEGVDFYEPTRELTLQLAAHAFFLAQKSSSIEEGYKDAQALLENGAALKKFMELCQQQGPADITALPKPITSAVVESPTAGTICSIDTEKLGWLLVELGAGRARADDAIDPAAGIEMLVRLGQTVEKGQPLVRLFGNSNERVKRVGEQTYSAFVISSQDQANLLPLVSKVIT